MIEIPIGVNYPDLRKTSLLMIYLWIWPDIRILTSSYRLDHFKVLPGAGFPDHPHRGMQTVTYLFRGTFKHEDFLGYSGT